MYLRSPAFPDRGNIPVRYTCEGKNISPPLVWGEVPPAAESLVLIMEDPDVPRNLRSDGMWDHWLMYDIPAHESGMPENGIAPGILGKNTRGELAYGGPCPPDREHRYFFRLYALDTLLQLPAGATKAEILQKIQGHVLAQAELMGRYECKKKT